MDARLVIRLSKDLRAWIGEQAALDEMGESAWVRALLAKTRRGGGQIPVSAPMQRSVSPIAPVPIHAEPYPEEPEPENTEPVDVDAMIASQLAAAEEQGLTEPPPPVPEPAGGVRALRRPPVPFSQGNQPRHLVER